MYVVIPFIAIIEACQQHHHQLEHPHQITLHLITSGCPHPHQIIKVITIIVTPIILGPWPHLG